MKYRNVFSVSCIKFLDKSCFIKFQTLIKICKRRKNCKCYFCFAQAGGVIDHKDGMSLTALHHACVRGKISCVQVLLKHGADPNSRDKVRHHINFQQYYVK